jgi:phage terminase small subunit
LVKSSSVNLAETAEISALRVLKEHEKIAFSNAGQLRDGWITLKEFERLTDDQKACIQEISTKTIKRTLKQFVDGEFTDDPIEEEWIKIKLYDKQKSLDSIRAMLGFDAPEKREITGKDGNPLIPKEFMTEDEIIKEIEKIRKVRDAK